MVNLFCKKLSDNAILPTKGSVYAAGWDLYACIDEDIIIEPGAVAKIGTGIAVELEPGTAALVLPRSGLATKKGLRPANTPGLIDSDYRGQWIVALRNDDSEPHMIKAGERIAQAVIIPYIAYNGFEVVDELSDTERGDGGFGSTGTN